jgi:hypothetical protein
MNGTIAENLHERLSTVIERHEYPGMSLSPQTDHRMTSKKPTPFEKDERCYT